MSIIIFLIYTVMKLVNIYIYFIPMKTFSSELLKIKSVYYYLAILSFFYISLKYIISYLIIPDLDLVFKIIIFSDIEYYDLVESLSRFDFFLNRSNIEISNNIFGFSFFSLIVHSIFFKFFGFYSFLILEIFFIFFLLIILFKFLNLIFENKYLSLTALFSLYSIVLLLDLGVWADGNIGLFKKIHSPIFEFVGHRFPRSLVTSIPLFLILYNLLIIINMKNKKIFSNVLIVSLSLMFLANSFFYVFITLFITSFLFLRQKILGNYKNFLSFFLPTILGILIIFIQQYFSEVDYEFRIGMYYINFNEKLFLLKFFFEKIFQIEILLLLILNSFLIFIINKKNKNFFNHIFLLYVTFLISIISPFIFVVFSNKIISLYYFWTCIKFFGFFSLFVMLFGFFKKEENYKFFIFSFLLFFVICSINNYFYVKYKKNDLTTELNKVHKFLKKDYKNSNLVFLGLTNKFKHHQKFLNMIWLSGNNQLLMYSPGFNTSLSDEQLENLIFISLKSMGMADNTFKKVLDDNTCKDRSCFARNFSHKYSVNVIKHKKDLLKEYDKDDRELILNTPPIMWWYLRINNSEKKRMFQKYISFKFDKSQFPDLIVIDKNHEYLLIKNLMINYENIFETKNHFYVFKKKIN
jgi:hypothetical protein